MILVCEPTLIGNEMKYVKDCIDTTWISSAGKYIEKFEQDFAKYCGMKYGVACSNGTTALHMAVSALEIGQGDEVIIPSHTIISCANAVLFTGAIPVFVDSRLSDWNIDPEKIEEKITSKTKAIMVVHTYGHPCDMDRIKEIARKNNLKIIEDAAESHGGEYKGKKTGSLGDISCFSFYSNKIITTGEGGMVLTNDENIVEKLRRLRNLGFKQPRYVHDEIANNYRLTNVQAAIGCAQLENIDKFAEMRRRNAKLYNTYLKDVEGITTPPELVGVKNVYWMYGILLDKDKFSLSRDEVIKKLEELGVQTRTFFYPMHKQPVFQNSKINVSGNYPIAEKFWNECLYLPSSSHLTQEQIKEICDKLISLKR